jgi:hypothetical protein
VSLAQVTNEKTDESMTQHNYKPPALCGNSDQDIIIPVSNETKNFTGLEGIDNI